MGLCDLLARKKVIKYLGSKRVLVPVLGDLLAATGATTALDLFTGTTRVAQEFCRRGAFTTAVDVATYSEILAQCYVELNSEEVDLEEAASALAHLDSLPGRKGYFTKTFCEESRYFQPKNGIRIETIRNGIDEYYSDSWLRPILLTSLLEAADAVDSTVGLQMAYLKSWAPRASNDLKLRLPQLTPGTGRAIRGDVVDLLHDLPQVDLVYLDPPYNQHRYFTNYHIWETLIRWDEPAYYGVACKRMDSRDDETKSTFNKKREMPIALAQVVDGVKAEIIVMSFSNEGFVTLDDLIEMCRGRGYPTEVLAFDSRRYIGSRIGIFDASGKKVGKVSHSRNIEYILINGDPERVSPALNQILENAPKGLARVK